MRNFIRDLPEPRWAFALVAVVTAAAAILFYLDESHRAELLLHIWGVMGAGTVVALLLERRSEAVQHRIWLRNNAQRVHDDLVVLLRHAAWTAKRTFVLSTSDAKAFENGSLERTRWAVEMGHLSARLMRADGPETRLQLVRIVQSTSMATDVANWLEVMEDTTTRDSKLLESLPRLRETFEEFEDSAKRFLNSHVLHQAPPDARSAGLVNHLLPDLGLAAIELCNACRIALADLGL